VYENVNPFNQTSQGSNIGLIVGIVVGIVIAGVIVVVVLHKLNLLNPSSKQPRTDALESAALLTRFRPKQAQF
jgi:hypothetical protein